MIRSLQKILLAFAGVVGSLPLAQASEPSSVYLRCTMGPEAYHAFLASRPVAARAHGDWQAWFDSRRLHGPGRVEAGHLRDSGATSVSELLKRWMPPGDRNAASSYDTRTKTWRFAMLLFTDNLGEMIQLLAPLRGVAPYCARNSGSFLFIYPYLWGGEPDAFLLLDQGKSRFAAGPTTAQRTEAERHLDGLLQQSGGD